MISVHADVWRGPHERGSILINMEGWGDQIVYRRRQRVVDLQRDLHWIVIVLIETSAIAESFLEGISGRWTYILDLVGGAIGQICLIFDTIFRGAWGFGDHLPIGVFIESGLSLPTFETNASTCPSQRVFRWVVWMRSTMPQKVFLNYISSQTAALTT